jgi:hypothetical protein
MAGPFQWTSFHPRTTGLPVTIWISAGGTVTTNPWHPGRVVRPEAVRAWVGRNQDLLSAYWRGTIDGAELVRRVRRVAG